MMRKEKLDIQSINRDTTLTIEKRKLMKVKSKTFLIFILLGEVHLISYKTIHHQKDHHSQTEPTIRNIFRFKKYIKQMVRTSYKKEFS
jgi:hypothetical protein